MRTTRATRTFAALVTAATLVAGTGTAVAQGNVSDQIGVKINNCYYNIVDGNQVPVYETDENGKKIQKCETKEVKPSGSTADAIDKTWGALTSAQGGSSDKDNSGSSKDNNAEGSSDLPGWAIALISIAATLGVLGAGFLALTVQDFSIRIL